MRSYKLHMVQAFRDGNRVKRVEICYVLLRDREDDNFIQCLIFTDEAIFYISGKVNRYSIRI